MPLGLSFYWDQKRIWRRVPALVEATLLVSLVVSPLQALTVRVVSQSPVPAAAHGAYDVRYNSQGAVFLACGKEGVFEVSLGDRSSAPRLVVPGSGPGSVWLAQLLGVADKFLVVGAPAFQVLWSPRGATGGGGEAAFDVVEDLDAYRDRLLVLGWRRDAHGRSSPDGAMAWLGSLAKNLTDIRPVFFSARGPGSDVMGRWHLTEGGKVRFLSDGSFVIVPGVEPGVYRYSPNARLEHTWDSSALGIDVASDDSAEHSDRVAVDFAARAAFVNARCVVDDVIPLSQGPGLLLRRVERGRVVWRLRVLKADGGTLDAGVPLDVDSPNWHISADARGDRLVVLLREAAVTGAFKFAHPRLLEMEVLP